MIRFSSPFIHVVAVFVVVVIIIIVVIVVKMHIVLRISLLSCCVRAFATRRGSNVTMNWTSQICQSRFFLLSLSEYCQ